ncbi:hypothetical protein EYF80_012100 [Liparis tanakae]|uniref:Uncharacterized protein n=1 Tax=Liparis tanakae TaxID=230148 RepID=A0A4Z2IKP1_9TELE|nr:hypothetical protein EYF80_012100 [Liparis tanakae]
MLWRVRKVCVSRGNSTLDGSRTFQVADLMLTVRPLLVRVLFIRRKKFLSLGPSASGFLRLPESSTTTKLTRLLLTKDVRLTRLEDQVVHPQEAEGDSHDGGLVQVGADSAGERQRAGQVIEHLRLLAPPTSGRITRAQLSLLRTAATGVRRRDEIKQGGGGHQQGDPPDRRHQERGRTNEVGL